MDHHLEIGVVARNETAEDVGVPGRRVRLDDLRQLTEVADDGPELSLVQVDMHEGKNREAQSHVVKRRRETADDPVTL